MELNAKWLHLSIIPGAHLNSTIVSNWTDPDTGFCRGDAPFILSIAAMESNHLYMEQTLQPSYVAALFFLFQDAVAIDIASSDKSTSGSQEDSSKTQIVLEFVGNIQYIDINLSSPWVNIILTLTGAGLLLIASIVIGIYGGKSKELEVQKCMTAHNVAELLINDSKYPPSLLAKSVAPSYFADAEEDLADQVPPHPELGAAPATARRDNLAEFVIQAVALADQETGQQIEFADFGKRDPSSGTVFA